MPNAIQKLRKQRGLTAAALAKKMGLSQSSVTRAEHRPIQKLTMDQLSRYARALGVSRSSLVGAR